MVVALPRRVYILIEVESSQSAESRVPMSTQEVPDGSDNFAGIPRCLCLGGSRYRMHLIAQFVLRIDDFFVVLTV